MMGFLLMGCGYEGDLERVLHIGGVVQSICDLTIFVMSMMGMCHMSTCVTLYEDLISGLMSLSFFFSKFFENVQWSELEERVCDNMVLSR